MSQGANKIESSWMGLKKSQALDLIDKLFREIQDVELSVDDDLNIHVRPAGIEESKSSVSVPPERLEPLVLQRDTGDVWVEGQRTEPLTHQEFELVSYLYAHRNSIASKTEICLHIWPDRSVEKCTSALEKLISRTRAKIEPDQAKPRFLVTVRGRGYRLKTK
jgi:DNA-binding response OmpR family regulator